MDGSKSVYLSNGDLLILLDGQYFISSSSNEQPVGIDYDLGKKLWKANT